MICQSVIVSSDIAFGQFLRLTLLSRLRQVVVVSSWEGLPDAQRYIVDLDTMPLPTTPSFPQESTVLCCSYGEKPADFSYLWADRPFRPARLLALLDLAYDEEGMDILLHEDRQSVSLLGEEVALSPKEFALLKVLYEAEGAYVSREHLLSTIWGQGEGDGVVNVYIHYLRAKLETKGHKYITYARNKGYALMRGEGTTC